MKRAKLIAVDIDGVILKDTFSPVLFNLIKKRGGVYDRETERNIFSRNQKDAAKYLIKRLNLQIEADVIIAEYFSERKKFLENNDGGLIEGAQAMLGRLSESGAVLVSYGGLEERLIDNDFNKVKGLFSRYICTNDFRPGVSYILQKYGVSPEESIFIDDVNFVAESCKDLGCGFIGMPSNHAWGWQKKDMIDTGVKYIATCPDDITLEIIKDISSDVKQCFN